VRALTSMRPQFVQSVVARALIVPILLSAVPAGADSAGGDSLSRSLVVTTAPVSGSTLEKLGVTIGEIRIHNLDVFDTDLDAESGALYRLANTLHIQTRPDIIRQQLLLDAGDVYAVQSIEESERILRANDYLSSAEIRPVRLHGDVVDIEVVTEDSWSLSPSLSFSRKGGQNTGGFELEDSNLLGSGSGIKVGYKSRLERDELFFGFHDRQLGASHTELMLGVADTSDGGSYEVIVQQPFYALDTRKAGGLRMRGFEQVDPLYSLGQPYREVTHQAREIEAFFGWSDGLRQDHVVRWTAGLALDDHAFAAVDGSTPGLPENRRDLYPFLGYEWVENRFETTRNADNLHVIEDRHLGTRIAARLGYASEALGSYDDAAIVSFSAHRGFKLSDRDTLLASLDAEARIGGARSSRSRIEGSLRYYRRQSDKRLLFAEAAVVSGRRQDSDEQIWLGGENGLRGYPVRYLNGDTITLLTLEQRLFTDWYPFHLFRVGAAAFADAGKVLKSTPDEPGFRGWYRDVGAGLRIGSPRSSSGRMVHIDLAYPLDGPEDMRGWQLVIETRKSF